MRNWMASLFELTGEALALQRQINAAAEGLFSDDPDEVAEANASLEGLISAEAGNRKAVELQADAWCWLIDQLLATATAQQAHAQRLSELAKAGEHRAEVLKDRLVAALGRIDQAATTWTLPEHRLASRRVTTVELDPELQPADLPERFQRVKTTYAADKTALKAALALGEQITGATLVERRSWSIR